MVTERNALEYEVTLKKAFVEKRIEPMLREAVGKIKSVEYNAVISADGSYTEWEIITVNFKNGGSRNINVSGDSCLQMAKDVLSKFV